MFRPPSNLTRLRNAWRAAEGLSASAPEESCLRVVNAEIPKLYVYDMIGGYDNDAADFARTLDGIDSKQIELRLNSPGGFVYDAVAMFEALDAHPAKIDVHIDGLAASAASFLAMVGDTISIARAGRMMVHNAQAIAIGGPAEMQEAHDLLESVSDDIAGYYAARAGGKPADWRTAMNATTWYSADQAVGAGLADRVTGPEKKTSEAANLAARTLRARAAVALGRGNL